LHGTDITLLGRDPSFEPVISFAINQSDAVTAVSQSLRSDTFKLFGVNREIEVVPNFYCASHFDLTPNEEFRQAIAPQGEPILTHISNFRPVKRIPDVMALFREVRQTLPAKLLMIGDGPERAPAEHQMAQWGLQDDVVFLGKVKNPVEALMISDLFLLPSESESFGLAALEAMAAGVPVIGSNAGGMPEVIRHGVSGLLSDVGAVGDLARNAIYLLESRDRWKQFSQQAKERALEFRIDRVLPRYESIYQQVMQHG